MKVEFFKTKKLIKNEYRKVKFGTVTRVTFLLYFFK